MRKPTGSDPALLVDGEGRPALGRQTRRPTQRRLAVAIRMGSLTGRFVPRSLRRGITAILSVAIVAGVLVVAVPAPSDQAGADPAEAAAGIVVGAVFNSLSSSYNSAECQQNPKASGCGGTIGNILRFIGNAAAANHAEVMQQLTVISGQLTSLQATVNDLQAGQNQDRYKNRKDELHAAAVLEATKELQAVTSSCKGLEPPYAAGTICRNYLGDNYATDPLQSQIAKDIKPVIANGPYWALDVVTGTPDVPGLFQLLQAIMTDRASGGRFFTAATSTAYLNLVKWMVDVETAYYLLWSNYQAIGGTYTPAEVTSVEKTYDGAVAQQLKSAQPLPKGTSLDVNTGVLWSTDNGCIKNMLEPPICGIFSIGGFPLKTVCPQRANPSSGANCQLAVPLDNVGSWTGGDDNLHAATDTAWDSFWKVPTQAVYEKLVSKRSISNPQTWLDQVGDIHVNGNWIWTSTAWCNGFNQSGANVYCSGGPFRTVVNLQTGAATTTDARACDGGPCKATYIFEHQLTDEQARAYGVLVKHQ